MGNLGGRCLVQRYLWQVRPRQWSCPTEIALEQARNCSSRPLSGISPKERRPMIRVELLIVSSRVETKRALLQILDGLPLNVYCAGTVEQAVDALEKHGINVVVSDEHLSDGTYHDILALTIDRLPKTQLIVLLNTGRPCNLESRRWCALLFSPPILNWRSFARCVTNPARPMRLPENLEEDLCPLKPFLSINQGILKEVLSLLWVQGGSSGSRVQVVKDL